MHGLACTATHAITVIAVIYRRDFPVVVVLVVSINRYVHREGFREVESVREPKGDKNTQISREDPAKKGWQMRVLPSMACQPDSYTTRVEARCVEMLTATTMRRGRIS